MSPASADPAGPAAAAEFVDLGTAGQYSVLAGGGVSNTGSATVLALKLGLSPAGVIAGFPPGTAQAINDKNPAADQAQEDRQTAYDAAAAQDSTSTFAGDQAGVTFGPGVHTSVAASTNTGTMTLDADGDSSAVFVFQIGGALSPAASAKVVLTDGALANNVYWQVVGAVSLGANAKYVGTFLGASTISFGEGASLKGRALTPSTVALANSPVTQPIDDLTDPLVSINGGATRSTNDATPAISGTTDEPAGRAVHVTVGGQNLTTTVAAGGVWSVSANTLAPGPHDVVATITDPSQNVGTATQVLTVDVTAPVVTFDDGASAATKDKTPLISGTTDAPADTPVTVTVAGQTMHTTVGNADDWSVTAATLTETAHNVVASVEDAAHNTGSANQILTVDVTKPVVTIDGGAARSTDDTSPWIYGTTAEPAGTTVHVTIDDQELTATVLDDGTWGVSAQTVPEDAYDVVASITDAALNTGTATQRLTIGDAPATRYQPDAAIRQMPGKFVGAGIYDVANQTVTKRLRSPARTATFEVRVTNRGDAAERMRVHGTPRNSVFRVVYLAGDKNVTAAVAAGTYRTPRLAPGKAVRLVMKVTRTKTAHRGDTLTLNVTASSVHTHSAQDTVAGIVRLAKGSARTTG